MKTKGTEHTFDNSTQENLANIVALLRLAYDFAFDQVERPEEQKSQAEIEDGKRYSLLREQINSFIKQYDSQILKQGSEFDKLLNFANTTSELNSENINDHLSCYNDTDRNNLQDKIINKSLQMRRSFAGFAAGFFLKPKDVAKLNKLPEETRKKIKLIQKCIALEQKGEKPNYDEVNKEFKALTDKAIRRDRRNILKILASQSNRKILFTSDTAYKIFESVTHPITKTDENLNILENTFNTSKRLIKKTINAVESLIEKGSESAVFLTKHSIKQPLMASYRLPMSILNGLEYIVLQGQTFTEKDEERKAKLQQDANKKFNNLGYEGEKFLRALSASIGIALVDAAVFSTAGVSLPAMPAVHFVASEVFLGASEAAHHIQTIREATDTTKEIVEKVINYEEEFSKNQKIRRKNIISSSSFLSEETNTIGTEDITLTITESKTIEVIENHSANLRSTLTERSSEQTSQYSLRVTPKSLRIHSEKDINSYNP